MSEGLSATKQQLLQQWRRGIATPAQQGVPPRKQSGPERASLSQRRLWFLEQVQPGTAALNLCFAAELLGPLDTSALELALNEIVRRHEVLRTRFETVDGEPWQRVEPHSARPIPVLECEGETPAARRAHAIEQACQAARQPFVLERGPLTRAQLFRVDAAHYVFAVIAHHTVFDGWSNGVFVAELVALYGAYATRAHHQLPELTVQYQDYTSWQRERLSSGAYSAQLKYWGSILGGDLERLDLPSDRPRPRVRTMAGGIHRFRVPGQLSRRLEEVGKQEQATLFMTLLAAYQLLLSRYSGQIGFFVGTPIANRTHSELEPMIGAFINVLPIRADLSGAPSFRELLRRVRGHARGAFAHEDLPFDVMVETFARRRDLASSPIFQVMLVLQNSPSPALKLGGVDLKPVALFNGCAQYDQTLFLTPDVDGHVATVEYSTELFDAATIERMFGNFLVLLGSIVESPDASVDALTLLDSAERDRLVRVFNATQVDHDLDLTLPQRLAAAALTHGPRIAVEFEDQQLSYTALDQQSNQVAHWLLAHGAHAGARIGICVERSLALVSALVGTLKAGCAYVPLDPSYPRERLLFMAEDAGLSALVVASEALEQFAHLGLPMLQVSADGIGASELPVTPVDMAIAAESAAYIIYTSGSTGRPKGAINAHRGICNRLLWMQRAYGLTADDRVLQKTPISFDVSVWELFWPLCVGARLIMARPGGHQDSRYLRDVIQTKEVTVAHFVPSMLQLFLEEPQVAACHSLRHVFASGESLPSSLVERFFTLSGARLHNLYGPTECAVDVTAWECQASDPRGFVPIGHPIDNVRMYVLDGRGEPAPIGVAGELWIAGVGVGLGYLRRPDLTSERFLRDPFFPEQRMYRTGDLARVHADGAIEFLGRSDFQVKLHGVRIELGEIEQRMLEHSAVREVIVGAVGDAAEMRLVAYAVAHQGVTPPSLLELRRHLTLSLPEAFMPTQVEWLDRMPLLPNGKVDRSALPRVHAAHAANQPDYVAPRNATERVLCEVIAEVLGRERVGIDDSYFAIGGDSIRSIRVRALAEQRGVTFKLEQLFVRQTARELAEVASQTAEVPPELPAFALLDAADRALVPAHVVDAYPLTAVQAGMLFHSQFEADSTLYRVISSLRIDAQLELPRMRAAIDAVARAHPMLRSSFALGGYSEPLQLVHREVELALEVVDARTLTPDEQSAQVRAWQAQHRGHAFDLTQPGLARFCVHWLGERSFQLSVVEHHAILDGWSDASMLVEILSAYGLGRAEVPPPQARFVDYVAREREAIAASEAREFFKRQLVDGEAATPHWVHGTARAGHRVRTLRVSSHVTERLVQLAAEARVPLKSLLLSVHLRVLRLLSGRSKVVTGVVTNARLDTLDAERVLGVFLNTLPMTIDVTGESWLKLARRTLAAETALFAFRHYPLPQIQRDCGGREVFDTFFNYLNFHVADALANVPGLKVVDAEGVADSNFALAANFMVDPRDRSLSLVLDFDGERVAEEQSAAIVGYYERGLHALAHEPSSGYQARALLGPDQVARLTRQFNATERPLPPNQTMLGQFLEQVAESPHAEALADGARRYSFAQLDQLADAFADLLAERGVSAGALVGVCVERSASMLAALLGIMKVGGAYVPLDPTYPRERIQYMSSFSRLSAVVLQRQTQHLVDGVACARLDVAELAAMDAVSSPRKPRDTNRRAVVPTDLAYVIFTSGSTGLPKGVMVSHHNVMNFFVGMDERVGCRPGDSFLAVTSISFDISVLELLWTLSRGAKVVLASSRATGRAVAAPSREAFHAV